MTLACIIFTAIVFVAQGLAPERRRETVGAPWRLIAYALVPLVLVQIFLGGLVAGLDAGLSHNTWPLMDGHFLPPAADLYVMSPAWVNHFENAMTVQFQHRMLAYAIAALVLWQAFALHRAGGGAARRAMGLAALVLVQMAIGIMTLLLVVPLWAALLHQATAVLLLAMATVHARAVADSPSPAPGRLSHGCLGRCRQRLIQVGDDVGRVLDADREAHHIRAGARLRLLLVGKLAMRGRGRMDDQRAGVADIGEMGEQLDARRPSSRPLHSRP